MVKLMRPTATLHIDAPTGHTYRHTGQTHTHTHTQQITNTHRQGDIQTPTHTHEAVGICAFTENTTEKRG